MEICRDLFRSSRGSLDPLQFPLIPVTCDKGISNVTGDICIPVVDAIVMPTIRSAEQISCAVELASVSQMPTAAAIYPGVSRPSCP